MNEAVRLKCLRIALILAGIACLAVYPLMLIWPSGWVWHAGYSDCLVQRRAWRDHDGAGVRTPGPSRSSARDVPALLIAATAIGFLMPRGAPEHA